MKLKSAMGAPPCWRDEVIHERGEPRRSARLPGGSLEKQAGKALDSAERKRLKWLKGPGISRVVEAASGLSCDFVT